MLTALGVDVTPPVALGPVLPEPPDSDSGPEKPALHAEPVGPKLLELDPAAVGPEPPEVANGVRVTAERPPAPPRALPVATPEPPRTLRSPPGVRRVTRLVAGAPPPEMDEALPAVPPPPPVDTTPVRLAATPVSPDSAVAADWAPLFAEESTLANAAAAPVDPDDPVLPERTGPPTTVAVPKMAELVAVGADVAPPVLPVGPESPATALGWAAAVDVAAPVAPVFVLPDWAVEAPELPLVAVGVIITVEAPPLPPLADPVATPLPPVPTVWADAGLAAAAKDRAAAANAAATAERSLGADDLGSMVTGSPHLPTRMTASPTILTRR